MLIMWTLRPSFSSSITLIHVFKFYQAVKWNNKRSTNNKDDHVRFFVVRYEPPAQYVPHQSEFKEESPKLRSWYNHTKITSIEKNLVNWKGLGQREISIENYLLSLPTTNFIVPPHFYLFLGTLIRRWTCCTSSIVIKGEKNTK